jgi:hypothetical protein
VSELMLSIWANQLDCSNECIRDNVNVVASERELKNHDSSCVPCSILVLSPNIKKEISRPYTKSLRKLGTVSRSKLFGDTEYDNDELYSVYAKQPKDLQGVIASAALPSGVQQLHTQPDSPLTFVLSAKVSGIPAVGLWDIGAATSFISKGFAVQHGLQIQPSNTSIILADGTQTTANGYVTVKLQMQKYCHNITFQVIDLLPQFDFILGNDWSQQHQVQADFGDAEHSVKPRLNLCKPKAIALYPSSPTVPIRYALLSDTPLLSAVQALRAIQLLQHARRTNDTKPFLVLIRESSSISTSTISDINSSRVSQLNALLEQYDEVFAAPSDGAHIDNVPQCIQIAPDSKPPDRPAFRLSMRERQEVEKQVAELLAKGWTSPSNSNYGAPVLFVPKPDGSMRMCIDYRALNKITTRKKYPLPCIDDLMDNLSGAKFFSSLDLTSGYHQLLLDPSDHPKTAFTPHIGKYEWKVLPMGLTNAPAVFQNTMHRIFGPCLNKFICVYLDDVLIFSKSEAEHFRHLSIVLNISKQHNLKGAYIAGKAAIPYCH